MMTAAITITVFYFLGGMATFFLCIVSVKELYGPDYTKKAGFSVLIFTVVWPVTMTVVLCLLVLMSVKKG